MCNMCTYMTHAHVCVHTCMHMHTCVQLYMCACNNMYVCTHACIHTCMCVCMYTCMYMYTCVCVCVLLHVCACVCTHVRVVCNYLITHIHYEIIICNTHNGENPAPAAIFCEINTFLKDTAIKNCVRY